MKIYAVGGAVRDELLGRPVADRDFVVVGATPQAMLDLGYRPVGREFPGLSRAFPLGVESRFCMAISPP